jgi:hypothetical protein
LNAEKGGRVVKIERHGSLGCWIDKMSAGTGKNTKRFLAFMAAQLDPLEEEFEITPTAFLSCVSATDITSGLYS